MKATKYFLQGCLPVLGVVLMAAFLTGCLDDTISSQVDENGIPEITGVRYVSPDSSRNVEKVGPGAWVILVGRNMDATVQVFIDGVQTSFNPTLTTDTTLIVQIPADLPFGSMDPTGEDFNTIRVVNGNGSTKLDFPVVPPAPVVAASSNEFAYPGETVTLTGQYLYLVEQITFPGGIQASEFTAAPDGTWLRVKVPSSATSTGAIEIRTSGGTSSSAPAAPFNDPAGVISNFDDINTFQWWSASMSNDPALFPNGWGNYIHMKADDVAAGDAGWWNGGRSINLNPSVWVAPDKLTDLVSNYALKFELNVREPMKYGALLFRNDDAWTYIARFEPWTKSGQAYSTNGWTTITIPLTEFRTKANGKDGTGSSVGSLIALLGSDGAAPLSVMYVNDAKEGNQNLNLAIDNIRIVKVR